MNLSKSALLKKFPFLEKFSNQEWVEKITLTQEMDASVIPLHCAIVSIESVISFINSTPCRGVWEKNFSVEVRLKQILNLLKSFCEMDDFNKTLKGSNLQNHPTPHHDTFSTLPEEEQETT